jgi:predicted glycosyltransferase
MSRERFATGIGALSEGALRAAHSPIPAVALNAAGSKAAAAAAVEASARRLQPRPWAAGLHGARDTKRILVYSHDTFGLGNIRRMLGICKRLVAADPHLSVLLISGSPLVHAFPMPPQIDYIKLPCLARTLEGAYEVKFLGVGYDELIRLRTTLITSTILDFSPDLILVDKKPFGVSNELSPGLQLLHCRGSRAKVVLLLRDILDDPETTTATWTRNHYHEAVRSFYDRILVVGSREIFDLAAEYNFPACSERKLQFCGYLRRDRSSRTREQVRRELGVGDEPLVLVTSGGGEDGYQLLANYVEGFRQLRPDQRPKTLLICGPEMAEPYRQRLREAAGCPGLIVQDFNNDMIGCMDAADLVVSMAGYNTVCEILSTHRRAIVVPRVRPVQEQLIRAERMARQGLLRMIHPDQLTPRTLMSAVTEELSASHGRARGGYRVDLEGMSHVVRCLHALLQERNPVPMDGLLGPPAFAQAAFAQ